jgi:ABC-type nitrate/sulfonate/bicarbonate transport system permease component
LRAARQVAAPPIIQETEEGLAVRVRYDLSRVALAFAAAAVVGALLGLFVIR